MKMKTLIAVAVAGAFAIPFATQASVDGDRMIVAQAGGAGAPGGASMGSGAPGGAAGGAAAQSGTPGAGSSTGQTGSGQPGTGAGLPPTDMQQLDANNDGYVSREEAAKNPSMGTRFSELDKDSDGRISKSEWEAGSGSAATGATGTTTSPSSPSSATGSSDPARDVGTAASRPAPSTGSQTTK
jgi:hypothetical protein